ncbi:MAG: hypothetical protein LQ346_001378 [Caloplaca aetnensis]|nr:MAG: hypothetical protein LQ346_001378 [Caloplaca aetnensis]
MLWYRLASLLLCSLLLPSPGHARALDARSIGLSERDPQSSLPHFATYGPPKPWNKQTCRDNANQSDLFLTFAWGAIHSKASIVALFASAKQRLDPIIQAGYGDRPIPLSDHIIGESGTGVSIVARPFKRLFKVEPFTYSDIARAVHLLQNCGMDQGHYQEMYANVLLGKKQIGTIYIGPRTFREGNPSLGGSVTSSE